MNKEIKITLDLDAEKAVETLENLDEKADKLAGKLNLASGTSGIEVQIPDKGKINDSGIKEGKKDVPGKNAKEYRDHQEAITAIEKKYSQQRRRIISEENQFKTANLHSLVQTTGVLFGRQGEIYKAFSLAEATISAYNAANAALLPPPIGFGPILGEIQAGIVLMNSMKRVEKIAASHIPGYAKGGIIVGEEGPEVIENMQDYAAGRAELIEKTIFALENNIIPGKRGSDDSAKEIKSLREDLNKILERPSIAYLNDREAKKIYYSGGYAARKNR